MSGESLDAREVVFGDVTFKIGKLMPMEAKRVFLKDVRPLLRGALNAEVGDLESSNGDGGGQWKILLAAFTDAPQEHYDAIVRSLYAHIKYATPGNNEPQCLLGDEENAFKDLDMAHSLMLDARAFFLTFSESWSVILSEYPSLKRAFQSLNP